MLGTERKTIFGTTFGYDNTEGTDTVFHLSPPATEGGTCTETILHDFRYGPPPSSNTDGVDPESAPIIGKDGTLYGTTLELHVVGQHALIASPEAPTSAAG